MVTLVRYTNVTGCWLEYVGVFQIVMAFDVPLITFPNTA